MKSKLPNYIAAAFGLCFAWAAQAGTFTDNFNASHDYATQGVADTPWSGMTAGVANPGSVSTWDANVTAPGTLTITNAGGAWADGGDGPFLWKRVSGDFTNTVHVTSLGQINYNFAGLLVRNPAAPANWFYLSVFAEYGVEIDWRDTIDGASTEGTSSGGGYVETNSTTWRSWLQLTRVGGVLSAYASTDGVNWEFLYQSARTDLTNDLDVGVFDSTFSDNTCSAQFQGFSIEGPNVETATPPSPVSGLTLTPAANSLDVSWTAGAGSDGSLVLVREAAPIIRQPVDGGTYAGNATFGAGDDLGEGNFVAYVGSGTSVSITNLTPTVPYTVAVYAYSGTGAGTVYARSNAPSATGVPSGTPTGITISFGATNAVAVDDTLQAKVTLHFDSGSSVDVTGTATFSSDNPAVASVSGSGLASGLSGGTAAITANYDTFMTSSNITVVKLPVTDDFSVPRNYLTEGIAGTMWNGLLLDTNDLPFGGNGIAQTLAADAGVTTPGRLTVQTKDSNFASGQDAGFFLYRIVNGDFSIAVQLTSFDTPAYHMPGLMVRAPFEMAYTENFLQWVGFNEYGIGNFSRQQLSGAYAEKYFQPMPAQPFIMIQRETNTFKFYQKAHALDAWTLIGTEDHPEFDGVPLQVGLVDQTFTANIGTAEFDNLVLTVPNAITNNAPSAASGLTLTAGGAGEVTANWSAGAGSSGSIVIAHPLFAVSRQPVDADDFSATANADFTVGADLGGSNIVVYAGTGTSVDVTSLPLSQCYFSVYSYANVGGTNYYNLQNPASASINLAPVTSVSVGITNVAGGIQISWPQGTLLEATNILGPWTTNVATSPLLITNPVGNRFFRVQLQ